MPVAHYPITSSIGAMLARKPDPWNDVANIGIKPIIPADDVNVSVAIAALESATRMVRKAIGSVEIPSDDGTLRTVTLPYFAIVVHRDARAWGHITLGKLWRDANGNRVREIMVSAENLSRGAVPVTGTLLHEMAHALNLEAEVRDCDVNGRHNRKFKHTAESIFGLEISNHPRIGWSPTTVPVECQARWEDVIRTIAAGIVGYCEHDPMAGFGISLPPTGVPIHRPRITGGDTGKRDKNNPKYVCGCGESLRMSRKAYDRCMPTCQECGEPFIEA